MKTVTDDSVHKGPLVQLSETREHVLSSIDLELQLWTPYEIYGWFYKEIPQQMPEQTEPSRYSILL